MDAGAEGRRDVGSSDRSLDDDGDGDRPLVPRREGGRRKKMMHYFTAPAALVVRSLALSLARSLGGLLA